MEDRHENSRERSSGGLKRSEGERSESDERWEKKDRRRAAAAQPDCLKKPSSAETYKGGDRLIRGKSRKGHIETLRGQSRRRQERGPCLEIGPWGVNVQGSNGWGASGGGHDREIPARGRGTGAGGEEKDRNEKSTVLQTQKSASETTTKM